MKQRRRHRYGALAIAAASLLAGAVILAQGFGGGQQGGGAPVNASQDAMLRGFRFRSIGPATMGGRVDDIEGAEKDPMIMYVGFATGGLWKSTDGGIRWTPQLDALPNNSIGDIAIAPSDPNVVYVGMGEPNNRQSASIGNGVYGTKNGGQTWEHLGLDDTQSISRIVVDGTNPNIVFVAALGHLFGPNDERGLYKSIDGGKTWKKTKFIDADTGFTDLAIDPINPKILYAASYSRRRTWWGFNGGGPNSGLWKSIDAGETWTRVTGNGWPQAADGLYGRIAISIFRAKPTTLYAQVEVGASGGTGGGTAADGGPARGGRGGGGGGGAAAAGGAGAGAGAAGAAGGAGCGRWPRGCGRGRRWCRGRSSRRRWRRRWWRTRRRCGSTRSPQPERQRRVSIGRCRQDVARGEQPERSADVLQPDSRRSDERPEDLRRRQPRADVGRRRKILAAIERLAHRLPRHLDQSEGSTHRGDRSRRRLRHQLRRRRHRRLSQRRRGGSVLSSLR